MDEPIVPTLVDSVPEEQPAPAEAPADAPSPTPEEKPADAPAAPADAPAAPELFDLPDGRKVDAAGLKKVYEELLPEFTRRSQELAEYKAPKHINKADENIPDWKKEDYVPKTYAEVIEIATQQALEKIQQSGVEEKARTEAITAEVEKTVSEIKASDPSLNEDALFQHAVKYGFRDLKAAHTNMIDMRGLERDTEQRVLKNLKTRATDTVSGGSVPSDGSIDPAARSGFRSATEFFQHIKGN